MQTKKNVIINFITANRIVILFAFLFGFFSIVANVLVPIFLGKFYQLALHTNSTRGGIFDRIFGEISNINSYFICFGLLIAGKFIFNYFEKYFSGISGELFSKSIREKLFSKQLASPLNIHNRKETGMYLLRYGGDLSSVQNYLTKGIISFINDCLFLVFALIVLCMIHVELGIIVILSLPFIFLFTFFLNSKLKKFTRKRRNIRSVNLAFVTSRLNALLTVKAFNRQAIEQDKYNKGSTELFNYGKKYYMRHSFIYALLPLMLYSMLGVVLITAYRINNSGNANLDGSVILIFIMLMINTMPVLRRVIKVNFVWQAGDVSFKKLLAIFNTEDEDTINDVKSQNIESYDIEFKNVYFGFAPSNYIFEKLSFKVKSNTLTIIKGKQGSGKSTLLKLILGLYNATEGEILIGERDIKTISKRILRKNITIVSYEFPLIGKTIFEAISYSRKDEKRASAINMLQRLNFRIDNQQNLLDYPIKEGGRNLSAGQKKLLLIARALLTNKKILLLDDPFLDLDSTFKSQIFDIIDKLQDTHTIVMITQDESFFKNYEQIIQLSKSSISPIGIIN